MRTAYLEVLRNLTFKAIKLETRMSERQVAMLRWSQINGDVIHTSRQRDCKVSREVINALSLLPHSETVDLVFFGNSLSYEPSIPLMDNRGSSEPVRKRFFMWKPKEAERTY